MNADSIPILGELFAAGPNDRIFDSLLLVGPLLIIVIAAVGRSIVTTLLAVGYLVAFVGYTISKSLEE